MKRIVIVLMVVGLMLAPLAHAAGANLGIPTEKLLADLSACLDSFSDVLPSHYPLEYTENDAGKKSFLKLLGNHTSLSVSQDGDMVKSFKIVSDEGKNGGSYERTCEIDACFMSALLASNEYFTDENVMVSLSSIVYDREIMVQNGIAYRYITGEPFTTIVALEVTPAE